MDCFDLLTVQETLKGLLQNHSSKASILQCSAFFMVQLSHPYMTTGKTIALTRRVFVSKVMSLPFNMLSRLAIDFLPRSKHLLISWLQSPSAVILEPKKVKSAWALSTIMIILFLFMTLWWHGMILLNGCRLTPENHVFFSFYNLYCILLFRSQLLGSVHMLREEMMQGPGYRRQGWLGGIMEAACHRQKGLATSIF